MRSRIVVVSGQTRWVVLVGGWAVKVPRFADWRMGLHGLLGNLQERSWTGRSDRLCPVLFALPGGWLTVMPRAEPISDAVWLAWDAGVMEDFRRLDGKTELPVEYKRSSFGVLKGRVVAVDYGS